LHYATNDDITNGVIKLASNQSAINLVYIRAAIEAATGVRLSLEKTRQYLVEEGLITPYQAKHDATIFRGYSEFFDYEQKQYGRTAQEIISEQEPEEEFLDIEAEVGRENLRGWKGVG
jgi:hypothetical protein